MGYIAAVYTYPSLTRQKVAFRGYVKEYNGSPTIITHSCLDVRYNRLQALADAKKLTAKLKQHD